MNLRTTVNDRTGLELTPGVLARNLDYSRSWISRRLSKWTEAGLVTVEDTAIIKLLAGVRSIFKVILILAKSEIQIVENKLYVELATRCSQ